MQGISSVRAHEILETSDEQIDALLGICDKTLAERSSDRISFCSIINAKSGNCSEDCAFCAQSSANSASCRTYPLMNSCSILSARRKAAELGSGHFSIVTSGGSPDEAELESICEIISDSGTDGPLWCASLGLLSLPQLRRLKKAGLRRYHHNIETEKSFFPSICSTHRWQDRESTIRKAKVAGLEVCSGGIIGLGESPSQRVAMAFQLRDLDVCSIALNFLVPLDGTMLNSTTSSLSPVELLKTVIMFGMVCPDSELRICAGRESLGAYKKEMFRAGVTGIMTGDLLTTDGSIVQDDLSLLESAGRERVQ